MRATNARDLIMYAEDSPLRWDSFHLVKNSPSKGVDTPLVWWRTRRPNRLHRTDAASLRLALVGTRIQHEPRWSDAATGDHQTYAAAAIGICVRQFRIHPINATEIDLAVSATLAFALLGDAASAVLISWALRHRAKIDPPCAKLSDLWLIADFDARD